MFTGRSVKSAETGYEFFMRKMDRSEERGAATVGMFDGVHRGHRHLLHTLRSINTGRRQPLAVTFPQHPLSLLAPEKAPKLITSPEEKVSLLHNEGAEVAMLDFDRKLASMTASEFMTMLRDRHGVSRLLLGFSNRFGSDRNLTFDDYCAIGAKLGIEVIQAGPLPDGDMVSSSAIRSEIIGGDIKAANEMLGRPFSITGQVVAGKQIGRTIGFPTANISIHDNRLILPRIGVYACDAILDDNRQFRAAVNIGVRPTIDPESQKISIESHIIGFSGDLYGSTITLRFLGRLRDERRFDSRHDLCRQLAADSRLAADYEMR